MEEKEEFSEKELEKVLSAQKTDKDFADLLRKSQKKTFWLVCILISTVIFFS